MADIVKKMLSATGGSSDNVLYGDEIMSPYDLLKIMGGDADSIFEESIQDSIHIGGSQPNKEELMTQSQLLEVTGGDDEKGTIEILFYQGSDTTGGEATSTYEELDTTGGEAASTYEQLYTTGGEAASTYEDAIDMVLTHDSPIATGGQCGNIFSKKCTKAMTLRDFKACVKKTKGRKNNIVCSDDVTKALHKFSKSLQL